MARNGSGVYTNPYPNFVAGTVISSTEVDANNAAMGTALTGSIAADGQTTVTGNLPMATYKFTGLGAGSASTDSANLGQVQAGAYIWCGTMGGAADAGTLSPTPAITAYAAGQRFAWKASTNTNTGAMTIAISGLATIAAQSDRTALAAGNHAASDIYVGILDTTSTMQIMKFASGAAASITTAMIQDNAVTLAKMAHGTDGNIITYDAAGAPAAVATGSAGSVLISGGAGVAPTFTSFTTVDRSWTGSQRATFVADNDGSFDMNAGQNFTWTPAGTDVLEFTNETNGQSGLIYLNNASGHSISLGSEIMGDDDMASTISTAGQYLIGYVSYDGTNVAVSYSQELD